MSCVFVLWLIVFMAHPLAMDMQREIEVAAALRAVVTDYFCSSSGRDDDDFDSDLDSDMDCDSDNDVEMEEELPEIEDMDI